MRDIPVTRESLIAHVEGDVGEADKVLRITSIRVRYSLQIPKGKREAAERAIATHERKCPAATSVRGSIPIDIQADIEEA